MPNPVPGTRRPDSRLLSAGAVTAFVPRTSAVPSVHFPGIQIVHRSVLADLPDDTPAESVLEVYPRLMATQPGVVRGAVFDAHFDDVGTVEDYRRTCRALAGDADGNVIDPLATVAADARLRGCIVWPGARCPPGAVLDDVVVTGHVPLAAGTRLERHRRLTSTASNSNFGFRRPWAFGLRPAFGLQRSRRSAFGVCAMRSASGVTPLPCSARSSRAASGSLARTAHEPTMTGLAGG